MKDPAKSRRFLLLLSVLATLLLALIIAPFAGGLFAAAVFATVLHPLQKKLAAALGDRQSVAAIIVTAGLTLTVVLPLAWLTLVTVRVIANTTETMAKIVDEKGVNGLVQELPSGLQPYARRAAATFAIDLGAEGVTRSEEGEPSKDGAAREPEALPKPALAGVLGQAASLAQQGLAALAALFFETAILILALFFFLAEGRVLLRWMVATVPLERQQTERFLGEFRDVTIGVFISTVSSAAIQSAIAAIGFLIAGVPMFAVLLMLTFVAAFIPAIGGATVVVVVGLLTLLNGSMGWGIFLVIWGLVPVGLSDNIAKPLLARGKLRLPGSVIFFAMLGGLVMLGPMGVVGGPLIVSFFLVVTRALGAGAASADSPTDSPTDSPGVAQV